MVAKKNHTLQPPKPHFTYSQLVENLKNRGMLIPDNERAERKLAQIGYYRLSGFWYPCRQVKTDSNGKGLRHKKTKKILRRDCFQSGTNFNDIVQLYLFDKKLRLLMIDAIERIEIHIRSVVAHEVGAYDPMAYKDTKFINPRKATRKNRKTKKIVYHWKDWSKRQEELLKRSKEDCIKWHKVEHKAIPFWVAIESWDFGALSKYYSLLNGTYQNDICNRLDIPSTKVLGNWLQNINDLRNKCAHHSRIWNHSFYNPVIGLKDPFFNRLELDDHALSRVYGIICILWFLLKKIGPSSGWLNDVATLINSKPTIDSCPFTAMGFPDNTGFPKILCDPQDLCEVKTSAQRRRGRKKISILTRPAVL